MRPSTGHIVRFDYDMPQTSNSRARSMTRNCLVVDHADEGIHVSPIVTDKPRQEDMQYAVPLGQGIRNQLGIGSKPAWVLANHLNFARHNTSSLRPVQRPNAMPQHKEAAVSRDFLAEVRSSRRMASKHNRLQARIPGHDAVPAQATTQRTMPGQARNTQARTSMLQGIAARLMGERKEAAQERARETQAAGGPVDFSI